MQKKKHSKIIALCLVGLACFLAHTGYTEDQSYAGRLMQIFTGASAERVTHYYLGAGASLLLGLFWLTQ